MVGALWTGISGLSGAQRALDNESNNIANVNTLGYKASRIAFSDQMYQDDIGKGVSTFDVEKLYTQGNLKVTGVSYDMALSGDGFFQVSDGREFYYSRAGNFRMGENGELQNAGGYKVQGWAMASIQPNEDVKSTDENVDRFSGAYNKLLGNAIFRNSTDITTKITKATDYTETARADSVSVFTGAGQKTASTKISDVELLVTEYNYQLTLYNNSDPKPASTESKIQRDLLDFDLDTVSLATGDEMYIYIDGTKYSQSFEETEEKTFKLLVDKISNIPGFKAYMTDGDAVSDYPLDTQDGKGQLVVEGMIPGKQFSITEFGWTDASAANQATKGTVASIQEAVQGTGLTAIKNIEDAMADAVSGKQYDVWTPTDLFTLKADGTVDTAHDFTFSIKIYDKELKENIYIPNDGTNLNAPVALAMAGLVADAADTSASIDAIVAAINTDTAATNELSDYVKAYNINGNLVIKTLDKNSDVEFTSDLKTDPNPAVVDKPRNATHSNREGAYAEFLSMTTMINQAATKSDMQLRLDTLNLTDSAFGDFRVDATGLIIMKQDGADFAVGQIAIAKFTDNRGLEAIGNNLLMSTNRSGQAIFNMDNEKTAEIKGGTLELSTSDLSESLVNLMVFQRAFEANSKSITTSDQILTTLIQMKR